MSVRLRPYQTYRSTGLTWLGKIPDHWDLAKVRHVAKPKAVRGSAHLPLLSVYREYGVIRRDSRDDNYNPEGGDLSAYKVVSPGDLVINKMKAWQGSLGISPHDGIVSPAYIVCSIDDRVIGRYLHYLLRSRPYVSLLGSLSFGVRIGQWDLRFEDLKNAPVLLPPAGEQTAIVSYLDWFDRSINRLIRNKRSLIALLTEQKQAIIQQAVTRGLDPDVLLKPSGVEWLGEIPAHWQPSRIKHFARVGNGSTPSRSNMEYWNGGHYPWLNSSYANRDSIWEADQFVTHSALRECHLPIVQPNSVILAITGQGKTRGKAALLRIEATINQHLAFITPKPSHCSAEFLHLALVGAYNVLRSLSDDSGSTRGALTCGDVKNFWIALPPTHEQEQITEAIDRELAEVDGIIERIHREVNLIQEYRTRLIADVVTGQIDVRALAASLPEDGEPTLGILDPANGWESDPDAAEDSELLDEELVQA